MKKTKPKYKSAAVVTIRGALDMTPDGRKAIATWLRKQATNLVKHGKDYAGGFQARYLYQDGK